MDITIYILTTPSPVCVLDLHLHCVPTAPFWRLAAQQCEYTETIMNYTHT